MQAKSHADMLHRLQCNSFAYFVHETTSRGLVLDKTANDWPASIAAIGMALTVYPVGVRRRLISRTDAARLCRRPLRFFASSQQDEAPDATGYRGFYYHFLDAQHGRRAWHCELSSVDTALFIAGALTAAEFFDRDDPVEAEIRSLAKMLYERIDWAWMLAGGDTLCHGWKPESGFLPHRWEGYDEALILYFLALGSPTHPIGTSSYAAWLRTYEWKKIYGIEYLYAGPLFIHQMSHLWVDFRGIRDRFMREHDCDYFENSRRATQIQQEYALRNPLGFDHYGEFAWGVTASDGPGDHRSSSVESSGRSTTTSRVARRTGRTTARSRLGQWSRRSRSRRKLCCRRSAPTRICTCALRIRTASKPRSTLPSASPRTPRTAGSRRSTSASTKGLRC